MPLLATFLASCFSAALSVFARFFVLEKAAKLAALVVVLGLVAVLMTAMRSCVDGVCATSISGMSSSHPGFAMGLGIAINSTTLAAVGCYMSVWIVCQLYVIKKKAINMLSGTSM
jgi:hypothetical protein